MARSRSNPSLRNDITAIVFARLNKHFPRANDYAHALILLEQRSKHVIILRDQRNRLDRTRMKAMHELCRKECLSQQIHAESAGFGLNNHNILALDGNFRLFCNTKVASLYNQTIKESHTASVRATHGAKFLD